MPLMEVPPVRVVYQQRRDVRQIGKYRRWPLSGLHRLLQSPSPLSCGRSLASDDPAGNSSLSETAFISLE